jgi:HEAT repeat protein
MKNRTPQDVAEKKREVLFLQSLQSSLRAHYTKNRRLEEHFGNDEVFVIESFINVALDTRSSGYIMELDMEMPCVYLDERLPTPESSSTYKEHVELTELFEPKEDTSTPHKILIWGRMGVGKTILCQYLATQWASESKDEVPISNNLRQQFEAVFWLRLGEIAAETTEQDTLIDMIDRFCLSGLQKPSREELTDYLKKKPNKLLFILDSYDEIADYLDKPDYNHLARALGEIADFRHVLLTSRSRTINHLGSKEIQFDRCLEQIGLLNENVETYVETFMQKSESAEQTAPLLAFLKSHPTIWGIAHIPVHLELLCSLWVKKELVFDPTEKITLSKLYRTVVGYTRAKCTPTAAVPDEGREYKQEETVIAGDINKFLEYLAYSTMEKETSFISPSCLKIALEKTLTPQGQLSDEIDQTQLLKSSTNKLSFLRALNQNGKPPLEQDHYFIHLFFQEFYAASYIARHLSEQPHTKESEKILQLIRKEKYTSRYQWIFRLSAGLLYQECKKNQQFSPLLNFWGAILSPPREMIGFQHMLLVMYCLEECAADNQLTLHKILITQQARWLKNYIRGGSQGERYLEQLAWCPIFCNTSDMEACLLEAMESPHEAVQLIAFEALQKLNHFSESMIEKLSLSVLQDSAPSIRENIVKALGKLKNPNDIVIQALLLCALQDKEWATREKAIEALDKLRKLENPSEAMIPLLLSALQAKERETKEAALNIVSALHHPNDILIRQVLLYVLETHEKSEEEKNELLVNAPKQGNDPSESLVQLLHTAMRSEWHMQKNLCAMLGNLNNPGEIVRQTLLDISQDKQEEGRVRTNAIKLLGKLKNTNDSVTQALLEIFLENKDREEQDKRYLAQAAAKALGNLRNSNERVIQSLLDALDNKAEWWMTKCMIIETLKNLLYPEDHDYGYESLFRKEMSVRKAASKVSPPRHLYKLALQRRLVIALQDKERAVRKAAIEALIKFNALDETTMRVIFPMALQNEDQEIRYGAVRLIGKMRQPGEGALRILIGAAQDEEEEIRDTAIRALCKLTEKNLYTAVINLLLQRALSGEDRCAVRTLGKLKPLSKSLTKALLPFLKHPKGKVRRIAVEILGKLHDQSEAVNKALLGALQDKEEEVRRVATHALGNTRNPSAEVITGLLNASQDKNSEVQTTAIEVLGKLANPNDTVIQVLLAALQGDDCVRRTAAQSLSALKDIQHRAMMFEQLIASDEQSFHYFSFCFEENHFLYIDHEQGRLTMRIPTQTRHIPLSPECLARLEQQIIATAQRKDYPLELYTLASYNSIHQEKSFLQAGSEDRPAQSVSDVVWAVHLVRRKNSRNAFLVIEGMTPEEYIIRGYRWVALQSNNNASPGFFQPHPSKGHIVRMDNFLDNLKQDKANYQSKSWAIDAVAGQQFLQGLDIETNSHLNNAPHIPILQEEPPDSLAWAKAILKKIGLSTNGQWANFVIVQSGFEKTRPVLLN